MQTGAANNAANAQATASANNLNFEKQVYGNATSQLTPTINQGTQAGSALAGLLDIGGNSAQSNADFQNYLKSTNYQFLLNQGEQAQGYLNAPNLDSGATSKALNNYAQGQAGSALQGYEALLAGQQGLGANSALGLAGVGNQNAALQAQANNLTAGAQGTSGLVSAGAQGSALSGLAQALNQYNSQSSFSNNSGIGGSDYLSQPVTSASALAGSLGFAG